MRISQFLTLACAFIVTISAGAVECEKINNLDAIVDCLLEKHPQVNLAKLNVDIASGEINRASQRINPVLDWEGNEAQNRNGFSQEINLKHTIELGSKQSARVKFAEAGANLEKIGVDKEYNKAKIQLILNFYRYRQILHELKIVEENRDTFKKMISQYRRIGKLNPEQEVSTNVFTMTMEEVRLKYHHLENERDEILANFEIVLGKKFVPKENQLPPVDHHWPTLKSGTMNGPLAKESDAKLIQAKKLYDLEKSKSWPNLAIGPRVQTRPGPQGGSFVGAAVSLPIPVLSLNGGGREKALALQRKREIEKRLIERKLQIESRRLVTTYNRSIESHSKAIKTSTILREHKKLHRMIGRGVISPVMVIELHRELIEFYEALHEHELDAVKTRWQYYSLHGKLDQEKILEKEVN